MFLTPEEGESCWKRAWREGDRGMRGELLRLGPCMGKELEK